MIFQVCICDFRFRKVHINRNWKDCIILFSYIDNVAKTPWTNTATVRPNNAIAGQRTNSMPQLLNEQSQADEGRNYSPHMPHVNQASGAVLYGPPKPPRTAPGLERANAIVNSNRNLNPERMNERSIDKAEIRTALQNWQKGILLNDHDAAKNAMGYNNPNFYGRSSGDGKPAGNFLF